MAGKLTELTTLATALLRDALLEVSVDPTGTPLSRGLPIGSLAHVLGGGVCQHRLTTETGVPVSTSDRLSQSTIYFTPYTGNKVDLYDGTNWRRAALPEIGLALASLTSGKNYDVFAFTSTATPSSTNTSTEILTFGSATGWATGSHVLVTTSGGGLTAGTNYFYNAASATTGSLHTTLANALSGASKVDLTTTITSSLTAVSLELSASWTNDTTRSDAVTTQDSVVVKSGATTRVHIGTIRTTSTTTTEDSFGGTTTQVVIAVTTIATIRLLRRPRTICEAWPDALKIVPSPAL